MHPAAKGGHHTNMRSRAVTADISYALRPGTKHLIACSPQPSPAAFGRNSAMEIIPVSQANPRFATSATAVSDPLQVIETAYRRIDAERDRNCWIHVRPIAETRDCCRTLMARARAGETFPLLGVLFGVKDNIDVAGMPTTAACPAFGYTPTRSARSVPAHVVMPGLDPGIHQSSKNLAKADGSPGHLA